MGLEKYESKQQQIFKPAASIYPFISRFDMLTPALKDKVEEWSATEDTCSFKVKGFTLKLRMTASVLARSSASRTACPSISHFGYSCIRSRTTIHVCVWSCMPI